MANWPGRIAQAQNRRQPRCQSANEQWHKVNSTLAISYSLVCNHAGQLASPREWRIGSRVMRSTVRAHGFTGAVTSGLPKLLRPATLLLFRCETAAEKVFRYHARH